MTITPEALGTGLDSLLFYDLEMSFKPDCEHHQHDLDKAVHTDGPGVWYEHPSVQPCGLKTAGVYICQGWKDYMDGITSARCSSCGDRHVKTTTYTRIA